MIKIGGRVCGGRKTIYQGPGRPGVFLRSETVLNGITFEHVGWSLLRTFTPLHWEPCVNASGHDIIIKNCHFKARSDTVMRVIPEVIQQYKKFTPAKYSYIRREM